MNKTLALGLALLIAGIAITWIPVKIEVNYRKLGVDDHLEFKVYFTPRIWGATYRVPLADLLPTQGYFFVWLKTVLMGEEGRPLHLGEVRLAWPVIPSIPIDIDMEIIRLIVEALRVNRWLFSHIRCHYLRWETEIGTGDPATTGISFGALWALKTWVYINLQRNVKLGFGVPNLRVIPYFGEKKLNLDFQCIFGIRAGHIIVAGLCVFWQTVRLLILGRVVNQ